MTPGSTLLAQPSCVEEAGSSLCSVVYDVTGVDWLATSADALIATPSKIVLIIVVALVVRFLLHRAIRRLTRTSAEGRAPGALRPLKDRTDSVLKHVGERRRQRAETIGSVLRSVVSLLTLSVATMLVLGELGINLAPIIASAGIVGVALGFGAQNLVKDFISGIFMILEDQYGVGDVVDLGEATGSVEAMGLRVTTLRDMNGMVWYVRNGEVLRVGNKTQGWSQVVLDLPVAHDTDLDAARVAMKQVADDLRLDPEWSEAFLGEPEDLGVESIAAAGITLRLQVRTTTSDQWRVARELRLRIKERFDADGIRTPPPYPGLAPPPR
ncbi:MAG: mechanosensitive ion channel family protein [Geodermatophilaceae bacterium]|nr:mechanosensitive ion channel family protein [Geodermatophilaceae bacterium]MDQ3457652.1 mechanosensitive ion channel family protein [Actinomycetota bacterium]